MVLRGVFTATQAETEQVFARGAVRKFFPGAVERLEAALPPDFGEFAPETLLELLSKSDDATSRRVCNAWIRYAIKVGSLHTPDDKVKKGFGDWDARPAARIDCHYMANACFLEEGQLLRDADKLKDIPVTIINGRYDMICPPIAAYQLHKRLAKSKLIIVEEAGHSEGEEGTTRELLKAVAEFE
jgi:proline iminopeptidase